jgi:two-component system NtrC family sensor kinase
LIGIIEAMQASSLAVGESAERISKIVKRLRSFARLDEAELQRVDLNQCLDETLELLHTQLKQNILVNRKYGSLQPITCYPSQLNQVFLNLILNSRDSIDGRGEIKIETRQENDNALVIISDTGRGISKEDLNRIFDPGFTTKGVGVGTGLGLAICYQIIQDHKGEIKVESKIGEGTTVRLCLPFELD